MMKMLENRLWPARRFASGIGRGCLLVVVLLSIVGHFTGCATNRGNGGAEKPASPPGYESDTTPEHDGEDWIGGNK